MNKWRLGYLYIQEGFQLHSYSMNILPDDSISLSNLISTLTPRGDIKSIDSLLGFFANFIFGYDLAR